jgi:iron complex outermembrane receptor protein
MRSRVLRAFALLFAFSFLCVGLATAQKTVTGTVSDASTGETLPGANVTVKGTAQGTTTGPNGQYELEVPGPDVTLVFSFVGYQRQEVPVGDQSTIDVSLRPQVGQLEDLVVVGYGEQEQRDVTGSLTTVDSSSFNTGNVVSPEQLISGKVPGLSITQSGGAPGASSTIRIRGPSTVNASQSPLFVVDGVPITSEDNQAVRNPLNFLNPSDIKSINVLKDASATAIYGARGANGVIIIETKEAGEGSSRISYNGTVSAARVADRVDVLGPDQFQRLVEEEAPGQLGRLGDARTDWQDEVERDALIQEHNVSFARGYEDSNIRLSLSYLDQEGTLQNSSTERISTSLKYNQDFLDDALNLRVNLRGAKINNSFEAGLVGTSASFDPTQPIRDPSSPYGGFFEYENPLADKNPVAKYVLTTNTGETMRSLGNVEAEYQIPYIDGLSARVKLGYDVQSGEREFFAPTTLREQADSTSPGRIERRTFTRTNTLLDAFATYDRDFDAISSGINITGGYSFQEFHAEFPEFTAEGLAFDVLGPNSTDPVTSTDFLTTFVTETPRRLISGFGRLNYTFLDRYILKLTVRRDGSSRFGPENQWGTFPSASFGWRIHQESFLEDVDALSNLKFRASWGQTGNQGIGDFQYANFVEFGGPNAQQQFGDEFVNTARPNAADPTIQWEQTTTINVGLDYGVLDNRLSGSVEWYQKTTDDLLYEVTIPQGANLSDRVLTNVGSMQNTGVEVSVSAQVVDRENFSYNAQVNAATNDNELTDVPAAQEGTLVGGISGGVGNNVQIIQEGEPLNSFYLFQHKTDENGDPLTDGVDHNGDGEINRLDIYKDVAGGGPNGNQPDGQINEADKVVDESPQADWTFGHTSQLRYQNFDLSFTIRAELGNHVYNNVASNFGHYNRLTNFAPSNMQESVLTTEFDQPRYFSDYYVEDASFLRMDNISLGYNFDMIPNVNRLRLFATVQNPFVITGYSGPDPEVSNDDGNAIDNSLYPRSRTYSLGVNVQL